MKQASMYVVVGCSACHALWIREDDGTTATCPGCRRTHQVSRLRPLFSSDSIDAARDARTQLLADNQQAHWRTLAAAINPTSGSTQ